MVNSESPVLYKGIRQEKGSGPQPVFKDGVIMDIRPSQKIWNHSTEFNWGYNGSGPAQLALALLFDVSGDAELSFRRHQEFKWRYVAGWQDEWTITADAIRSWLSSLG